MSELLNSQERSALVKHVLESARAEPGDEHALEPALTLRPGQSIGIVLLIDLYLSDCFETTI